jgi:hypothetical protein
MKAFLHQPWYIRVIFDVIALLNSLFMSITYKYTTNLNKNYPSYLGMLIVNFMMAINLALFSYFIHGATFDTD